MSKLPRRKYDGHIADLGVRGAGSTIKVNVTQKQRKIRGIMPSLLKQDLEITNDEVRLSAPVIAACTKPDPPSEPMPPSWREYFVKMARYAQAIRYRKYVGTRHHLPDDWWEAPPRSGLSDLFNAIFLDAPAVAALFEIDLDAANSLMRSGEIPSFKLRGLPLLTTDRDLCIYLANNRVIDATAILKQRGWRKISGTYYHEATNTYASISKAMRMLIAEREERYLNRLRREAGI